VEKAETIAGGRFQKPFLLAVRELDQFSPWLGPDRVDTVVYSIVDSLRGVKGFRVLSIDFSKFDTSVGLEMSRAAFDLLRNWFRVERDKLDLLEEVFSTLGLVTPDGWLVGRRGAVPSGSVLTNVVDTLVNMIVVEYAALRFGRRVRYIAQGDDAFVAGTLSLDEMDVAAKELGMTLNTEKTLESDDTAHFLQKLYLLDQRSPGIASISRRATKLSSYENLKSGWNAYLESMRNLMLLEASRNHSNFPSFVKYVRDRDSILASEDPLTIAKKAGGSEKIKTLLSQESFPGNDRDISGLVRFESVKLLRELGT
jgi:hypothetical protein